MRLENMLSLSAAGSVYCILKDAGDEKFVMFL